MRILLDEQVDWRLARVFSSEHEVGSVRGMGLGVSEQPAGGYRGACARNRRCVGIWGGTGSTIPGRGLI